MPLTKNPMNEAEKKTREVDKLFIVKLGSAFRYVNDKASAQFADTLRHF